MAIRVSPAINGRRLAPRRVDLVGFWHNVGYVVHGNRLTVSLGRGLENDLRASRGGQDRARFTITLCPKKIQECRRARATQLRSATAMASAETAAAACHPAIEQMFGLQVPPSTQLWVFK